MNKSKNVNKQKNTLQLLVELYLGLILLGLPLAVTNGFYNITETKVIYYVSLSFCLVVTAVIKTCISRSGIKNYTILDIAIGSFFLCYLISSVLSEFQTDVWFGSDSRYQGAAMIALYVLVYFIVSRNYLSNQAFLLSILIAFSIVSVIGVLNCFDIDFFGFYAPLADNYKEAYISTIGNVNFYSGYMCLIFPVVICGFCQTKGRTSMAVYTTALIVGSFGMMVTSSESFVVGFVAALILMPNFFFRDAEKLKKFIQSIVIIVVSAQAYLIIYKTVEKKNIEISQLLSAFTTPIISIAIILACGILYLLIVKKPSWLSCLNKIYIALILFGVISIIVCFVLSNTVGLDMLDDIFRISDSWGTYRGGIWRQCIDVFKSFTFKEKLFGIGPESLYRTVDALEVHGNKRLDQAHNEYLQYLLTTGICGLLSYLSVIVCVIFAVCRKLNNNTLAIGLLLGIIAYWIQAIVNIAQPFTTPIMYVFISCIGGMLYNETKKTIPSERMFNINKIKNRNNNES